MELVQIGYFTKTHGIKGHLILKDDLSFETEGPTALFVDSATGKAPYFIAELRDTNNGLIVKLEDVDAVEKAKMLVGKAVFIDAKFVDEEETDEALLGYELIDKHYGSLGTVAAVSHNGSQDLLSLQFRGREIILPFVEDFVERIDDGEKKIWFNAPEGLIDLYLEDRGERELSEE